MADGSTYKEVSKKSLKRMTILVPPLPEQQKIASILQTVDDAIQKTDDIIEKSRQLKKGLMQQLLTKGIEHTQFKETEIGEIPEEWEAIELVKVAVGKPQNGLYKKKEFYGSGYGIVRMTELFGDQILEVSALKRVSVDDAEIAKYSLKAGDLLFARRSLKAEGSGKCVIVPGIDEAILFESSIIRLTLDYRRAVPMFYLHYLNSPLGRRSIGRIIRTVAVSGITGRDIEHLLVPLPTVAEQTRISQILATTDKDTWRERQRKELLEELKNGLMQVLLTGKVRVKVT